MRQTQNQHTASWRGAAARWSFASALSSITPTSSWIRMQFISRRPCSSRRGRSREWWRSGREQPLPRAATAPHSQCLLPQSRGGLQWLLLFLLLMLPYHQPPDTLIAQPFHKPLPISIRLLRPGEGCSWLRCWGGAILLGFSAGSNHGFALLACCQSSLAQGQVCCQNDANLRYEAGINPLG